MPIGRSAGSNRMSARTRLIPSEMPTEEMNSDTTTSAPNRRAICRNGDSDTPAIGARKSGTAWSTAYGNCMATNVMTRCAADNRPLRFGPDSTGETGGAAARVLLRRRDQSPPQEHHQGHRPEGARRAPEARREVRGD